MNFLTDNIRPIYFKYLSAAFGSALISSIYGVVAAAMVGQYQGPAGTAALAVYGIIINISTFIQCCAYSIGQASRPIISVNYGAGETRRIGKSSNMHWARRRCLWR